MMAMTQLRTTLALLLLVAAVLLAAGCTIPSDVSPQNGTACGTGPVVATTGTMLRQYTPPLDHATAFRLYQGNLSTAQSKIPDDLRKVIDPAYPLGTESRPQIRNYMISMQQLLLAEDAAASGFSTPMFSGRPVGNQVHLVIHINPSASLKIVNPYLSKREVYDQNSHTVVAWVDQQDLERLAAMDEVTALQMYFSSDQPKAGNQVTLYDITGFLKEWNEKMHWGYSDGQINQFNRSLQNGLLKKYQGDSGLLSFNILDMKTFCLEVGDAIGLTKNQSEQFATAADEDLKQGKLAFLAKSEYYTTGPGGPGQGP
jgi:hypothetical protein